MAGLDVDSVRQWYDYVQADQIDDAFGQALVEGYDIVNPNISNGYYTLRKQQA